jgi:hypothetical protein
MRYDEPKHGHVAFGQWTIDASEAAPLHIAVKGRQGLSRDPRRYVQVDDPMLEVMFTVASC